MNEVPPEDESQGDHPIRAGEPPTTSADAEENGEVPHLEGEGSQGPPPEPLEGDAHPVEDAIRRFVTDVRDLHLCVTTLVPAAAKLHMRRLRRIPSRLESLDPLLGSEDRETRIQGQTEIQRIAHEVDRLRNSDLLGILVRSFFVQLFSAFDVLTGDLLRGLYKERPALFEDLDKEMSLSEIVALGSIDAVKEKVLEDEIDGFRRASYIDQFKRLENRFGLKLRAFDRWPAFVEAGQRRNIVTHCDGMVTAQYLQVCRKEGVRIPTDTTVGTKLPLTPRYFVRTLFLMLEVGVKLAQTLWRKTLPEQIPRADRHLNNVTFDLLWDGDWVAAERLGDFARSLPGERTEPDRRIALVNHAIALQELDRPDAVLEALDSMDWSDAVSMEFRLANVVLRRDYATAAALMRRIGTEGEYFHESSYHNWPLFRRFRQSDDFLDAYRDVFGYGFREKLQEEAEQKGVAIQGKPEEGGAGAVGWQEEFNSEALLDLVDGPDPDVEEDIDTVRVGETEADEPDD